MADDHDHDSPGMSRVTSPMQPFALRSVGIGAAVALVGLLVVFGLPLAL